MFVEKSHGDAEQVQRRDPLHDFATEKEGAIQQEVECNGQRSLDN
jgi:hypothetical protein